MTRPFCPRHGAPINVQHYLRRCIDTQRLCFLLYFGSCKQIFFLNLPKSLSSHERYRVLPECLHSLGESSNVRWVELVYLVNQNKKSKRLYKNNQQKSLWEIRHQRFNRHTCTFKTRCVQKNISSQLMAENTHPPTMEMKNYCFHKQHKEF